jgi:uncharacterized phage protein (TIGR01671 family)
MREIKFRAWDEQEGKMYSNDVQFVKSGDANNDWICFYEQGKQRIEAKTNNNILIGNPFIRQQIKLMQYTGLKDENGVEIYEGDIVKADSIWLEVTKEGTVEREYDVAKFKVLFKGYGWVFETLTPAYANTLSFSDYRVGYSFGDGVSIRNNCYETRYTNFVVIGDIYENPELLEDKQ